MRLIDADDLIKVFEALELMSGEYAESFTNMAGNRSMEIECAKDYINNAKTIDAVPVVPAHNGTQKDACQACDYYIATNGTCKSKKCSTGNPYVTIFDRRHCKPYHNASDKRENKRYETD